MRQIVLPILFLLLAVPSAVFAEGDEAVTRTYDLGAFVSAAPEEEMPVLGLGRPDVRASRRAEPDEDEETARLFLTPDALLEILQALRPAVAERARIEIQGGGADLVVTASPDDQEQVAGALQALWFQATQRILVEARLLRLPSAARDALMFTDLGAALARGRLSAGEVARLLEVAGEHGVRSVAASGVVAPRRVAVLGQVESRSHVADYDVEIAQDSIVGNPIVRTLREGWVVEARPFPRADGRVQLEIAAQAAVADQPIRPLALDVRPFGAMELPACDVLRLASTVSIAPAETWVGVLGGDLVGGASLLLVRASARGRREAGGTFRRFDVSALTSVPRERGLFRYERERGFEAPHFTLREEAMARMDSDALLDHLRGRFGDETWEREDRWLATQGGGIFASHEATVLDRLGREIQRLEQDLLRTHRLGLTIRRVGAKEDDVQSLASLHVDLPVGRNTAVILGREVAYLADWDVEVAQEARCGDPVVSVAFGGIAANLQTDVGPLGEVAVLSLSMELSMLERAIEVFRPQNECTGIVEVPKATRLLLDQDVPLRLGVPATLQAGTLGDGSRIEIVARLDG